MKPESRENILQEIAEAKQQVAHLREKQEQAVKTLQLLNERLFQYDNAKSHQTTDLSAGSIPAAASISPEDKIALFRRLFRGRRMCIQNCGRTRKRPRKAIRLPAQTNGFGEYVKSQNKILSEVKARYVVGLTATPERRDGHQPIIHLQIGPTRFKADPRTHLSKRPFNYRLVVRGTNFDLSQQVSDKTIQELYGLLVTDKQRNELIFNDVLMAMEEGRSPILLTERKEHLEILHEILKGFIRHIVVLRGGLQRKSGGRFRNNLSQFPKTKNDSCWQPEGISVKASMMHGLTHCFQGCQYPGKEPWSNMLDGYTGYTLENRKCVLLITSTTISLCWPRCLRSGVLATASWVIKKRRFGPR